MNNTVNGRLVRRGVAKLHGSYIDIGDSVEVTNECYLTAIDENQSPLTMFLILNRVQEKK